MASITSSLRVIISGGGTGGHVFPAIAIAKALQQLDPSIDLLFVGALGRLEMDKVPQAGYQIEGLPVSGFQRKFTLANFAFPFRLAASMYKAYVIVRRFRPHVALGVGGYASGPTLKAANWLGVPTVLQEQNAYAGVTNRLLAKRASKICVPYEGFERIFPAEKIIVTGNPVRPDIVHLQGDRATALQQFGLSPSRQTLLITGGSLGARGINNGITPLLPDLAARNIQLIWQCGKLYIDSIRQLVKGYENHVVVLPFIDDMKAAYIAADVIVSRAGAGAIAELCLVGKPMVLMPSPNVAEDHQTANAQAIVQQHAALMVKDDDAPQKLLDAILICLNNVDQRQTMIHNAKRLAKPHAAEDIAREILTLAQQQQRTKV